MVAILGANSVSGEYEVSNSLRFNDDDSPSLNYTQSAGNRDTWTFSAWIKRGNLGTNQVIIISGSGASDYFVLNFNSSDKISWHQYNGSNYDVLETSDAVFRDPSAWYHIVLKVDTTDSTADNRVILYVNGSVASHTANTTFDQNEDTDFNNNGNTLDIGNDAQFNMGYAAFDGYMTEINFIDGTAKAQTDFGEFDDNNVWIPKKYTGSYGTNGFFLEFKQTGTSQNSSGMGADTSGNDNHFAVTNLASTDITEDTCTNNFATINPLQRNGGSTNTLSEGNLKQTSTVYSSKNFATRPLTIQPQNNGKWYFEAKYLVVAGAGNSADFGVISESKKLDDLNPGTSSGDGYGFRINAGNSNVQKYSDSSPSNITGTSSPSDGDIYGLAIDFDNGKLYGYQNGTEFNGQDISAGTSLVSFGTSNNFNIYIMTGTNSTNDAGWEVNTGNPSFAISSGNNDGKYGNFEYAPPSGYYALCTKRLAEFG